MRKPGNSLWIRKISGEDARKIAETDEDTSYYEPDWSPDGQHVAYIRIGKSSNAIESRPALGGPATVLLSHSKLVSGSLCWTPDWRIIFALTEPKPNDNTANLWQMKLKPYAATPIGKPLRVTHWTGFVPYLLRATADGKRLTFHKDRDLFHGYLAELKSDGTLSNAQRLTHDEWFDWVAGWFPQGRTLLLLAERGGSVNVYSQKPGQEAAEMLVSEVSERFNYPVVTPDSAWILYWVPGKHDAAGEALSWRLMRMAASGGTPEFILETDLRSELRCPARAGAACVFGEHRTNQAGQNELTFYAFDPTRGKGSELARATVGQSFPSPWDISPDRSRIAVVSKLYGQAIRILRLPDGKSEDIKVKQDWSNFQSVGWAADGKSLFATVWTPDAFLLVNVGLNGSSRLLLQKGKTLWFNQVRASPDGRYLAFNAQGWDSNIWMLENY
jgi:Tol biopolymer transport system component